VKTKTRKKLQIPTTNSTVTRTGIIKLSTLKVQRTLDVCHPHLSSMLMRALITFSLSSATEAEKVRISQG
jgi:hypothetical protein